MKYLKCSKCGKKKGNVNIAGYQKKPKCTKCGNTQFYIYKQNQPTTERFKYFDQLIT